MFATRWKSIGHLFDEGILVCIFFGRTPEVLKLRPFHSLEVHFNWLLTPDDHSPLVGKALAIFSIVSGCTLFLSPKSLLPALYFEKMCEGRC